jgi:hypothetical protein
VDINFKDILPHEKITLRSYAERLKTKEDFAAKELTLFLMAQDIFTKYPELSVYDIPGDNEKTATPLLETQNLVITNQDYQKDIPF